MIIDYTFQGRRHQRVYLFPDAPLALGAHPGVPGEDRTLN